MTYFSKYLVPLIFLPKACLFGSANWCCEAAHLLVEMCCCCFSLICIILKKEKKKNYVKTYILKIKQAIQHLFTGQIIKQRPKVKMLRKSRSILFNIHAQSLKMVSIILVGLIFFHFWSRSQQFWSRSRDWSRRSRNADTDISLLTICRFNGIFRRSFS